MGYILYFTDKETQEYCFCMIRAIEAKSILATVKPSEYDIFGLKYNMNLYRGCQHACIYCDSRSTCYQLGDLSDIRMKENALYILENELRSKRIKGTIGFGSMNDPYMPVEKEQMLTRKALELIAKYKFAIHLKTKSNLVTRDIDILKEISKIYAAITITITTEDDRLSKIIEPGAPVSSKRFEALEQLSNAGIYCGITLMPVLPYITDNEDNIKSLVFKAKEAGVKYILCYMGMTLRDGQREYYYKELDKSFPGLKSKYVFEYRNQYSCAVPNYKNLENLFHTLCREAGIATRMRYYSPPVIEQKTLF
jgi:DNA repair photolyase